MTVADLVIDGFDRVQEVVHEAVDGLTEDQLAQRLDEGANSIAWLVWHLTRVQDDHIADLAGTPQVWTEEGWHERFGLPFGPGATGYGHRSKDVAAVRAEAKLLAGYHDAVHDSTVSWLGGLRESQLDQVVDEAWDPPVTLGVRLVSILSDDLQHAGQAAFIRGILERR
ncbi:DinB family protein [Amycolatopsis thermalba]|uniref:DinB family protein n=1 Tax=Amycolatopsis thermalba TaxID=944492 RepID=A0ABY4NVW6_9PSEU|nr:MULTISPECIES: DinB family protein [Amycolatopsis]UQS24217.1 DinB family protein [Amycolatopsis thermalba]